MLIRSAVVLVAKYSISSLIYCLLLLSITESEVLKFPAIIVGTT